MGYYINIIESTFTIPTANLDEAYKRMCALNENDSIKRGGSYPGEPMDEDKRAALGYNPNKWFSWTDPNYPSKCADAEAILRHLGFEVMVTRSGLIITQYDSKYGQEELFLAAVCDLATGYIVWGGENGERWRDTFGGKHITRQEGYMAWGTPASMTGYSANVGLTVAHTPDAEVVLPG